MIAARSGFIGPKCCAGAWVGLLIGVSGAAAAARVGARQEADAVRVEVDGKLFTCYRFAAHQKYPYFWPVNGPGSGQSLTTETSEPYPHHHSLFFGCDRVNGFNFWQEGNERGQIVSAGPKIVDAGPQRVVFTDRCLWRVPGAEPLIEDLRRVVITVPSSELRFIDFHITLRALTDVRVTRTNHSLFSMRVMPHLSVRGGGTLIDAFGRSGEKATFGRKGPWCDFSGENAGRVEGIAILDHPENAWFPAPWFTRDYGFASPTPLNWLNEDGWCLPGGETFSLKYRVVVHTGDANQVGIHTLYRQWGGAEDVDVIPVAMGFAATPVNGGQSLVSDGTRQFIAFYDAERQLTVGSRALNSRDWRFVRLDERVGWDSHNRVAIALDREGCVHLCANHHCSDLNYFRTKRPGDIDTFERIDRFGAARERGVTYPRFHRVPPKGELAVMYRIGGSGDGDTFIRKYDESSKSWSAVTDGPILKGRPRFSAYPMGMQFDTKGRLHLAWCWRETPDVATNQDVCYALSPDGGQTWQTSDGRRLPSPITPEAAEVIDPVPQGGGLMNGGRMALDRQDRPWITYIKFGPNGGTQMYAATHDGKAWRIVQITDWAFRWELKGGGSIPSAGIGIPSLSFRDSGRVDISFLHEHYFWGPQVIRTTIDDLMRMRPGAFRCEPDVSPLRRSGLDYSYAIENDGPLPPGEQHWMVQRTAGANRDREPEEKMPPTMIFVVRTGGT